MENIPSKAHLEPLWEHGEMEYYNQARILKSKKHNIKLSKQKRNGKTISSPVVARCTNHGSSRETQIISVFDGKSSFTTETMAIQLH